MLGSGAIQFFSRVGAILANGASSVHFLARPHVFTFLLLAASLWLLSRDRRRPDRAVWLLVPVTAIWVNMHGGFLALIVCLGVMSAGYALEYFLGTEESRFFALRYSVLT